MENARLQGERALEAFPGGYFAHQNRFLAMQSSLDRLEAIASDKDVAVDIRMAAERTIHRAIYLQTTLEIRSALAIAKIGFSKRGGQTERRTA